jgi:hypothetical protein
MVPEWFRKHDSNCGVPRSLASDDGNKWAKGVNFIDTIYQFKNENISLIRFNNSTCSERIRYWRVLSNKSNKSMPTWKTDFHREGKKIFHYLFYKYVYTQTHYPLALSFFTHYPRGWNITRLALVKYNVTGACAPRPEGNSSITRLLCFSLCGMMRSSFERRGEILIKEWTQGRIENKPDRDPFYHRHNVGSLRLTFDL